MNFGNNVTFQMFCSWAEGEKACGNAAVGEVDFYLDNNALPGKGVVSLPICQTHLERLDKPESA